MPNRPRAHRRRPGAGPLAALLLAFLLLPLPASADSNRKGEWSVLRTPSFRILFHEEVRPQAEFARDFLEGAWRSMHQRLGLPYRGVTVTVVLSGHVDDFNGFAAPLGHRIVIWTRPAQTVAAGDLPWLRRVLAHELAHQVTFQALRNVFGVYGEIYKAGNLPIWFVEGLAQYLAEAWDAKRATFFAHAVHNSALEPYPQLASFTRADPIAGRLVYEQGHAFVRFLAGRHGGPEFLGRLLRKVTCVPIYTELKALFSPITARILPLESALRSLTGRGIYLEYRDFLQAARSGLAPGGPVAGEPAAPATGLDLVHRARRAPNGDWIVAAQARWDEPHVGLYRVRDGRPEAMGAGLVHPVFDLSEDGTRLAFVREHTDVDGEPVGRLIVRDLRDGRETAVSDGAYHPAFLGGDTVAFSRWRAGRQSLVVCAAGAAGCRDASPDSLSGFYGLSRSRRGLLMNASGRDGRTGLWEWSPAGGFARITQDTVFSEFPVEAEDGSLRVLREEGGLMRPAALDRATGAAARLPGFPAGAFLLHRAAPGPDGLAAVAQVRRAPHPALAPVALPRPPASFAAAARPPGDSAAAADTPARIPADTAGDTARADSAAAPGPAAAPPPAAGPPPAGLAVAPGPAAPAPADTAGDYRVPAFLTAPLLLPESFPAPGEASPASPYNSLLGIRPLILWPYLTPGFREVSGGIGAFLEDPLALHSLTANLAVGGEDAPLYDVAYTNRQTPVRVTLSASNTWYAIDSLARDGDRTLYGIRHLALAELAVSSRLPWPLPRPHRAFLAGAVGSGMRIHRVGAAEGSGQGDYLYQVHHQRTYHHRVSTGYSYALPYAYAAAHPLRETAFGVGAARRYGEDADFLSWEALHVFPLWRELTLAFYHTGDWIHTGENRLDIWRLPGGEEVPFIFLRERGIAWDAHVGLDFPLRKGFLAELPLFGVCNFLGAGTYGAYRREEYERNIHAFRGGIDSNSAVAGGRLFALFHVMRRVPLVLSAYAHWDFEDEETRIGLATEVGALPSRVAGWTGLLGDLAPKPLRRADGLEDRLRRPPPLP